MDAVECVRCHRDVPTHQATAVQSMRATMSSPAEHDVLCRDCADEYQDMDDRDEAYERAAARYDGEGKDWR